MKTLYSQAIFGVPFVYAVQALQADALETRLKEAAKGVSPYAESDLKETLCLLKQVPKAALCSSEVIATVFFTILTLREAQRDPRRAFAHAREHPKGLQRGIGRLVHALIRLDFRGVSLEDLSALRLLLKCFLKDSPSALWEEQATVLLRVIDAIGTRNSELLGLGQTLYLSPRLCSDAHTLIKTGLLHVRLLSTEASKTTPRLLYAARGALHVSLQTLLEVLRFTPARLQETRTKVASLANAFFCIEAAGLVFRLPQIYGKEEIGTIKELFGRALERSQMNAYAKRAYCIGAKQSRQGVKQLNTLGLFLPVSLLEGLGLLDKERLQALLLTRAIYRKGPFVLRRLSAACTLHYANLIDTVPPVVPSQPLFMGLNCPVRYVRGVVFLNFSTGDTYHLERSIENALKSEKATDPQIEPSHPTGSKLERAKTLLQEALAADIL